jgi:hypothetical protein
MLVGEVDEAVPERYSCGFPGARPCRVASTASACLIWARSKAPSANAWLAGPALGLVVRSRSVRSMALRMAAALAADELARWFSCPRVVAVGADEERLAEDASWPLVSYPPGADSEDARWMFPVRTGMKPPAGCRVSVIVMALGTSGRKRE